jgi:hypothetical protein
MFSLGELHSDFECEVKSHNTNGLNERGSVTGCCMGVKYMCLEFQL